MRPAREASVREASAASSINSEVERRAIDEIVGGAVSVIGGNGRSGVVVCGGRLCSATVTTTEAPEVGKGIVGAVTSQVGRMGGRNVVICRALGSMRRGAITHADGVRLAEAADQARELGIPFVFFVVSSGADVNDGVAALHGWGQAAAALTRCSGVVPVIVAATGPVVSGPALLLGLSDFVVMSSRRSPSCRGRRWCASSPGSTSGRQAGRDGGARDIERAVRGRVRRRRRDGGRAARVPAVEYRRPAAAGAGRRLGAAVDAGAADRDPRAQGRDLRRAATSSARCATTASSVSCGPGGPGRS